MASRLPLVLHTSRGVFACACDRAACVDAPSPHPPPRIALLASSDAFRAMFNSGYREKEAASIDIPNIPYEVFRAMMHYIYTGQVEVEPDMARDLLQASDQYLLEGLKRLCEAAIAVSLTPETLEEVFTLSEAFSAPQLGKRCFGAGWVGLTCKKGLFGFHAPGPGLVCHT